MRTWMVTVFLPHSYVERPAFPFVGCEENATMFHLLPFTNSRKMSNFLKNIPSSDAGHWVYKWLIEQAIKLISQPLVFHLSSKDGEIIRVLNLSL